MWRSWKSGWLTTGAMLCALAAGCSSVQTSGIDPSGEHIFVAAPPPANYNPNNERYFDDPRGQLPWDDVAVQIRPQEIVAPVGSEVVLVAGVCGPDGYLRTNRRLEWTIAPGSVGHFVAVEKGGTVDLLLGDFNWPRKIDATSAIGSTSRTNVRLNRGVCTPENDVFVLRGEGWISLSSPVEGTSNVTVVAPEVYSWSARIKSAMVHWVDALVQYPPPAINPAGTRHLFTTTVTRHSNQSPCEGWRVRYEIVDGPPAGFSPDGATAAEVCTNSAGQASVEIFQKQPSHGTNRVSIQVIRPADTPGAGGEKLIVGSGTTTKTWTAPDLAVHLTGPAVANVGATFAQRIEISNPGDLPAKDVTVTDAVPDGLTCLGTNPSAEGVGRQLRWQLGELGARQQRTIELSFRAEKQGCATNCCEVTAAGGLKVNDCAATTIAVPGAPLVVPAPTGRPSLDVRITGPAQDTVTVGSQITFQIIVTNRGPTPATRLNIKDRFDPGLEHTGTEGQNVIDRPLGDLAAGETRRLAVEFHITKPGRLCHVVEVTGPDIAPASAQACVMAVGTAAAPGPSGSGQPNLFAPPGRVEQPQPTPGATPNPLSVKITGPTQHIVGETARFIIEVTNKGTMPLRNVKVAARVDAELDPTLATDGYRIEDRSLVWIIDSLPAGGSNRYEIQCKCDAVAGKTCNRVSVALPDGNQVEDAACLEIRAAPAPSSSTTPKAPALPNLTTPEATVPTRPTEPTKPAAPTPPAGDLTLSVAGLSNPVRTGKELTYEIRVTNSAAVSYRQVQVTATVPEGMMPVPLGTVGPPPAKFSITNQVLRFDPAPEVRPGETLTYRVRVRTQEAGVKKFHVELSAAGLPEPRVQEANTEVL